MAGITWADVIRYFIFSLLSGVFILIIKLVFNKISTYFDNLNDTLKSLNDNLQGLVREQIEAHAKQNEQMELIKKDIIVQGRKIHEEEKDIIKLYEVTDKHTIEIEILKHTNKE